MSAEVDVSTARRGHGAVLHCIVGPTAAGKSALALALAQARGLAIVSADSRQVYQGFDIGTAKPTLAEQQRVPHYGIDVVEPTERYSAHRWAVSAAEWLDSAVAAGTPPIIVGGTGLYIRALVSPFDAMPMPDPIDRQRLEPWLHALDAADLARWCRRLDPERSHLGRTQQLRAVETALLTGRRLSAHVRSPAGGPPAGEPSTGLSRPARYLLVDPGAVLAERIARRVRAMCESGFREEVDRLRASLPADAPAWKASGYPAIRASREGTLSDAEAIERVTIETRQYAKRQRTWFRHQIPAAAVTMINPDAPDALQRAIAWWDEGATSDALVAGGAA